MMAFSSCGGRRYDTGCGVAPIFHSANSASMKPWLFGMEMVTKSPSFTPRASSDRATRLVRLCSSP